MSPSQMGRGPAGGAAASTAALRMSTGLGLKEGFMRERVAQLEADLKMAQQREGLLETEAMQVNGTGLAYVRHTHAITPLGDLIWPWLWPCNGHPCMTWGTTS